MSVDGEVKFILHGWKKFLSKLVGRIIVVSSRVNVSDFLVEFAFAAADLANESNEAIKVVLAEVLAIFKPFIVQNEAFDGKFFENLGSPLAKLCGFMGVDAVADKYNGV